MGKNVVFYLLHLGCRLGLGSKVEVVGVLLVRAFHMLSISDSHNKYENCGKTK